MNEVNEQGRLLYYSNSMTFQKRQNYDHQRTRKADTLTEEWIKTTRHRHHTEYHVTVKRQQWCLRQHRRTQRLATRSDTDKHDRHRAPVGSDCLYDANALVHNAEKTHRFQKQTDGHQRGTAVGRTQSGVYHIHTSEYKTSNRSPTGTYYIAQGTQCSIRTYMGEESEKGSTRMRWTTLLHAGN